MDRFRRSILTGRILFGALWAGLLVVFGVITFLDAAAASHRWLGITAIAAGQLVFMYTVADRLCRVANRTPMRAVEMVVIAVTLAGLIGVIVHFDATVFLSLSGDAG